MFLLSAAELRELFRGDSALNSQGTAVTWTWGTLQSYRDKTGAW